MRWPRVTWRPRSWQSITRPATAADHQVRRSDRQLGDPLDDEAMVRVMRASRVGRARCCARPASDPDVPVSRHPAQASPVGLLAGRSAGWLCWKQRVGVRRYLPSSVLAVRGRARLVPAGGPCSCAPGSPQRRRATVRARPSSCAQPPCLLSPSGETVAVRPEGTPRRVVALLWRARRGDRSVLRVWDCATRYATPRDGGHHG